MRHLIFCAHSIQLLIFAIFSLTGYLSIAAIDMTGMILPSYQARAEYLAFLSKHFAKMSENTGYYPMSPSANIDEEQEFIKWLTSPTIQAVIRAETSERKEMKRLDIEVLNQQQQNGLVVSDAALTDLTQDFTKYLDRYAESATYFEKLRSYFTEIGEVSSHGMLVGLINGLPQALKAEAFRLELNEKLDFLKLHLTDQMVEKNFRGQGEKTVKAKLKEVKNVLKIENKIVKLALFLYWKNQNKNSTSVRNILGPSRHEFSDFVTTAFQNQLEDKEVKRVRELANSNIKNLFNGDIVEGKFPVWTTQATYRVEEVPAPLAVYRGCINGDCFTKYAFGFAFAPSERTFFVFNERKELLFTIYAMAVTVNGRPSLLIHEAGSASTNPEIVDQVVRGVHMRLSDLGYEHIVIGSKQMQNSTFADKLITSATSGLDKNSPTFQSDYNALQVTISHHDIRSRELIGQRLVNTIGKTRLEPARMQATYAQQHDLASYHRYGTLFRPSAPTTFRLQVSISPATNFLARYLGGLVNCSLIF